MKLFRPLACFLCALAFASCSLASTVPETASASLRRETRLTLQLVDTTAVAPVAGNEAMGDYKVEFSATAENGTVCFGKTALRNEHFVIVLGGRPERKLPVTANATLIAYGQSSTDTSWAFCVASGQTRRFALLVRLQEPEQPGFYAIRLKGLDVDVRTKVKFVPERSEFTTDAVYVDDEDNEN